MGLKTPCSKCISKNKIQQKSDPDRGLKTEPSENPNRHEGRTKRKMQESEKRKHTNPGSALKREIKGRKRRKQRINEMDGAQKRDHAEKEPPQNPRAGETSTVENTALPWKTRASPNKNIASAFDGR